MKKRYFILLLLLFFSTPITPAMADSDSLHIQEAFSKLPLSFIENKGQIDKKVKFYEKAIGHSVFFTSDGIYLSLGNVPPATLDTDDLSVSQAGIKKTTVETEFVKLSLIDSNKEVEITASDKQEGRINYFIGSDIKKWRADVPVYAAVLYKEVYKDIDIKFYGNNSKLEYDVIVKPGARADTVRFKYDGIKDLRITEQGDLEIGLLKGTIIQKKPYIYQEIDGKRIEVKGVFNILSREKHGFSYGFQIAAYDKQHDLIIDPYLIYSTYLGGTGNEWDTDIAIDSSGNAYVTGVTTSDDFPPVSAFDSTFGGGYTDAFVTKISPSGELIYSTYLGGSGAELGWKIAIAVDSSGNAYITGSTSSFDFPLASAFDSTFGGERDVFVTKISPSGGLIYSTYLGGSSNEVSAAIAVDSSGNAYVTGMTGSPDFPLVSAFDSIVEGYVEGYTDAFVTKINPSGGLIYSTYLGGSSSEWVTAIAIDSSGNAYVTGSTSSFDFPLASAFDSTLGWENDTFVTKISPSGGLIYSTYLGGNGSEWIYAIAVDSSGNAYVTGSTYSSDFPLASAFDSILEGWYMADAFVTKINPSGGLIYSTYLGGSSGEVGSGIAVDSSGNAYVTGITGSAGFPLVLAFDACERGEVFITKISPSGRLVYSTCLGGSDYEWSAAIAVDSSGNAYITGSTSSFDFPLASAFDSTFGGERDVFVTKISPSGGLIYSTYLGGSSNEVSADIAIDSSGNAYVTGYTYSSDFPLASAFDSTFGGYTDAFVAKISPPEVVPVPAPVPSPTERISNLIILIQDLNLNAGIENSLSSMLQNTLMMLNSDNITATCNMLAAFINTVEAQSGRAISIESANQLIDAANQIRTAIGC